MVRYYGRYSNVSRGNRLKDDTDDDVPCILDTQGAEKISRRNWARLIRKIYEGDPLVCPKFQGAMRVISSIEDPSVIWDILKYLGIGLVRSRPPPKIDDLPVFLHKTGWLAAPLIMGDRCCQLPINDDPLYSDPQYSCDEYILA